MATIKRIKVESSNIMEYGYDPETQIMEILFGRGRGENQVACDVYQYDNVTPATWAEFQVAKSKGRFFHSKIRNAGYVFRKL